MAVKRVFVGKNTISIYSKRDGRIPSDAKYVGRPSPFGNPFQIGLDGDRTAVIEKYREWVLRQPEMVARIKSELRGRSLVCWCAPLACHADVLAEIANAD